MKKHFISLNLFITICLISFGLNASIKDMAKNNGDLIPLEIYAQKTIELIENRVDLKQITQRDMYVSLRCSSFYQTLLMYRPISDRYIPEKKDEMNKRAYLLVGDAYDSFLTLYPDLDKEDFEKYVSQQVTPMINIYLSTLVDQNIRYGDIADIDLFNGDWDICFKKVEALIELQN